jgi:ActR/RegA family two-component response regulator
MMLSVARCFAALNTGLITLMQYYANGAKDNQPKFPWVTSIDKLKWQYIQQLYESKQVWLAKLSDGQKGIVLFCLIL